MIRLELTYNYNCQIVWNKSNDSDKGVIFAYIYRHLQNRFLIKQFNMSLHFSIERYLACLRLIYSSTPVNNSTCWRIIDKLNNTQIPLCIFADESLFFSLSKNRLTNN